jgi:hypothetical protein
MKMLEIQDKMVYGIKLEIYKQQKLKVKEEKVNHLILIAQLMKKLKLLS